MNRRGLTPLVGFVILVGITAVGAMSLFVGGMALADATQSDAKQDQAEQSMVQFADTANEIASSERSSGEFQLSRTDRGVTTVSPDAGHIKMWVESDTSPPQTLLDSNLGAYRYETADNEEVVFQGGGVWRSSGEGASSMVRAPPFAYRNQEDPTLTYEFLKTTSPKTENAAVEGNIRRLNTTDEYPTAGDPNPLEDGAVYMEIESEYCQGWENFFRQRTDGDLAEGCSDTVNTEEGEVQVKFVVPFEFSGTNGNTVVAQNVDEKGGNIAGDFEEGHDLASADSLIESHVAECDQGNGKSLSPGTTTDSGLYCTGKVTSGEYVIDTGSGDVEIAVDGRWDPRRLEINGPNNVTFYIEGDAYKDIQSKSDSNFGQTDPEQHRIFLHSSGQLGQSPSSGCGSNPGGGGETGGGPPGWGGANLEAFIYAPGSEVAVHGGGQIKGAVIADCFFAGGGSNTNSHPAATDLQLKYEAGGDPFYYLHVSKTTLSVDSGS